MRQGGGEAGQLHGGVRTPHASAALQKKNSLSEEEMWTENSEGDSRYY